MEEMQGNLAAISGPVYQAFNDLGTPLIGLAATVPPDALADLGDSLGDGQGFGKVPAMASLQDITVFALLIDRPGPDLRAEARLNFANTEAAAQTGKTLDGLIKLASTFAPDEDVRYLVERLELIIEDDLVTVSFQAPLSELAEALPAADLPFGGRP